MVKLTYFSFIYYTFFYLCVHFYFYLFIYIYIIMIYIKKKKKKKKKGSISDIVSKFEISVESITETYDISTDNKKNKYKNIDRKNTFKRTLRILKGYIINILLIGSILLLTIPVIVIYFFFIYY